MRKLFSTRVKVILVLAILLTAGLAVLSSVTGQSLPGLVVQSVITPLRSAVNSLTDQAEQYYNYMFQYEALAAENEALREQIAQMEDDARQADSISRENARLRELLALKSVHEDYKMVDAYIISWSSNDWTNTFTINRGTDAHMVVVCTHNHILITLAWNYSKYIVHLTIPDCKRLHVTVIAKRPDTPLAEQRHNILCRHAATLLACIAPLQRVGSECFHKKTRIG